MAAPAAATATAPAIADALVDAAVAAVPAVPIALAALEMLLASTFVARSATSFMSAIIGDKS